jgi:hypothetical protein
MAAVRKSRLWPTPHLGGVKERLSQEKKPPWVFIFSGHLFDEVASEVNQFVKRKNR